jgi:hypothetical protein
MKVLVVGASGAMGSRTAAIMSRTLRHEATDPDSAANNR